MNQLALAMNAQAFCQHLKGYLALGNSTESRIAADASRASLCSLLGAAKRAKDTCGKIGEILQETPDIRDSESMILESDMSQQAAEIIKNDSFRECIVEHGKELINSADEKVGTLADVTKGHGHPQTDWKEGLAPDANWEDVARAAASTLDQLDGTKVAATMADLK